MDLKSNYLEEVRSQYESYPYPERNPEDEKHRLLETELSFLPVLNHYCYKGKQDFKNFRVLVAGCGTGDAAIDFAVKLKDYEGSSVVALDMTKASLDIAKARAKIRGLENIEFIHGSLLDLADMGLELFDHINCCGVLHHLADPEAGLRALKSVLKPDGSLGLMLYGQYGRTGVYQMQRLMKLINSTEENLQKQVDNTKKVLGFLPASNWFKHLEGYFSDAKEHGDIGIYDLLLHSQDRAYTIPELYEFIENADLHFAGFATSYNKVLLRPENLIQDAELLQEIQKRSVREQQAICELLIGAINKHTFYASMLEDSCASTDDHENIPFFHGFPEDDIHLKLADAVKDLKAGQSAIVENKYSKISFSTSEHSYELLKLINGQNSIKQILNSISADNEKLLIEFKKLYRSFSDSMAMLLR